MDVEKAWGDGEAGGVERLGGGEGQVVAESGNGVAADGDIGVEIRATRAVDDTGIPDQQINGLLSQ